MRDILVSDNGLNKSNLGDYGTTGSRVSKENREQYGEEHGTTGHGNVFDGDPAHYRDPAHFRDACI